MPESFSYPVFLSLRKKTCLIIGFGAVGQRKLQRLLDCEPDRILVLDLVPLEVLSSAAKALLNAISVCYENRFWNVDDIKQSFLIFACTGNWLENAKICAICEKMGKLCNSITEPGNGSFIVPAAVREYPFSLALSTDGASPLLAARLARELAKILIKNKPYALFLQRLRASLVHSGGKSQENKLLFEKLSESPLANFLSENDIESCMDWIKINFGATERQIILNALSGDMK